MISLISSTRLCLGSFWMDPFICRPVAVWLAADSFTSLSLGAFLCTVGPIIATLQGGDKDSVM